MLKQLDLAILGGHFINDEKINYYSKLLQELLESYTPDLLSDCYIEYNNVDKSILYSYTEQRSKTLENALEIISNEAITSLGSGLKEENLNNIEKALNDAKSFYKPAIIPISVSELEKKVKAPNKIISGNPYLDNVIGIDGFEEGRSYIFASRAKGGKSLFLQNLAQMFALNTTESILYLSLENSEYDIVDRKRKMQNRQSIYKDYDVVYNPKANIEYISELAKKNKIIIVDYLARINPPKELEKEGNYIVYGWLADQLHYIAEENKCIIITASQLNRSALSTFKDIKDKTNKSEWTDAFMEIDQDSLSDSMGIVRNSDSISIVWFKDNEFHIHNVASRIQTKYEYVFCDTYNHNTIEITKMGGVYA